ncbi:Sulfite reductase [NADPH] subunit beta, partial [Coemansia spiralis]
MALPRSELRAPSVAAAVAYTAATAAGSTTAVVDGASTAAAGALIGESDRLARLANAVELGPLVAGGDAASAVVDAASLLRLIPVLRDASHRKQALVIHVPIATVDDVSSVLAVRDAGCGLLRSSSPQQAVDYALVATLAARRLGLPFVHCFPAGSGPVDVCAYEPIAGHPDVASYSEPAAASEEELQQLSRAEAAHAAIAQAMALFGDSYAPLAYTGVPDASLVYVTFGAGPEPAAAGAATGVLQISLCRPLSTQAIRAALPATAARVVALEQVSRQPTPWGPLLFDLAGALQPADGPAPIILDAVSTVAPAAFTAEHLAQVTAHARTLDAPAHFNPAQIARIPEAAPVDDVPLDGLSLEEQRQRVEKIPYGQLLRDLFGPRLHVANAAESASIWGDARRSETNPEFGFGLLAAAERDRARLAQAVTAALRDVAVPLSKPLHTALSTWLGGRDSASVATAELAAEIGALLAAERAAHPAVEAIHALRAHFAQRSSWLVGADEWAYDLGSSGVHHALSSGLNVNMLVLDTAQYPFVAGRRGAPRKKDIGLYAMNYGAAYVASVAVYASYTQVLQALLEADAFPGPAVVVAYLPHTGGVFSANYSPIDVLQQSKRAVDTGAWPLYRWDPTLTDPDRRFQLDSEKLRRSVEDFLRRDNALAAVGAAAPDLRGIDAALETRARGDVADLLGGLRGPPLLVLFASDGSNGEEAARRVARQGRRRGMDVRCLGMDEFDVDELPFEKTVVVAMSTAGQGEVPTNGREFVKALQAASVNLSETAFAVFGLGDSHYWPREEDAIFYNKPARDIDRRLAELSATRIVDAGLGDDQDADGWETGFADFEQRLWAALNIAVVGADAGEDEPPKRTDEENKVISNYLRGTIAQAVADTSCGYVDEWDGKLLKFHGTYMQDDRDLRPERLSRGEEKAFSFMIRVRLPGGVATPAQWLAMDRLADEYGNHTMKITTRQTFQLHGVLKRNLRETMRGINRSLMDTIAACGDVNRNVVASANPLQAHLQPEVVQLAADISSHLLPSTSAYHEIWLADELVAGS